MFAPPTVMTHDEIPAEALQRAGIRIASLVDAGEDIRPTRHQLVVFALALLAETVGSIRFDPTGLTPERQTPADLRFVMSANRTILHWHGALPCTLARANDDGTVTVRKATHYPNYWRRPKMPHCWHDDCSYCQ